MATSMGTILPLRKVSLILRANVFPKHVCVVFNISRHTSNKPRRRNLSATPAEVMEWKRLDWREYATGKLRIQTMEDSKFPVLLIPGHSCLPSALDHKERPQRPPRHMNPPRFQQMLPEQDWTNVWPAAETFKWSAVPLPVRQGAVKNMENDGLPRDKLGNVELMKIPNFLHLTPAHIKKQCAALKKFCSPWPEALHDEKTCNEHFQVHIYTRDYIADGPDVRDPRTRLVTVKLTLSDLNLDEHAKDKFLKLVGDRYDKESGILTLEADRCPLKKQNLDYVMYLLTALYKESWKTEPWETDQSEDDMIQYEWPLTSARDKIMDMVSKMKEAQQNLNAKIPEPIKELSESNDPEKFENNSVVQEYKESLSELFQHGEDLHQIDKYKRATKKLLLGLS